MGGLATLFMKHLDESASGGAQGNYKTTSDSSYPYTYRPSAQFGDLKANAILKQLQESYNLKTKYYKTHLLISNMNT